MMLCLHRKTLGKSGHFAIMIRLVYLHLADHVREGVLSEDFTESLSVKSFSLLPTCVMWNFSKDYW